jgi:uncharacterized protein (DUF4415 family)
MTRLVRKTLADSPMTPARKRRLAQLAKRPDSEIDFSDIPPAKESFWKNAVRNPFYRPVKQQLTVRLDAHVVAWLRQQGEGLPDQAKLGAAGSDAGRHQEKRLKSGNRIRGGYAHFGPRQEESGLCPRFTG